MKICELNSCNNELPTGNKKFCSMFCYSKSQIGKIPPNKLEKERYICENCSEVFYGNLYDKRKYCSRKCMNEAKKGLIYLTKHDLENIKIEIRKERDKLWSDKFDKYSCIKNDKWYLDWKKQLNPNNIQ